ncbi:Itpr1 [Symbiodinium natans]|uniref:Itpr1 protein n=1 Tax=Symbiodinium natans TaxID=878477 RepID=A0A812V2R9_9DINO|nr:Itpr1 [Symbiodinium natans]
MSPQPGPASLAKACQEANDEEYDRICRLGPYELEEAGLEAYHNNRLEEAERLLSAALRDSAPRRKAALLCARAAVRVALGEPYAGQKTWTPLWRCVYKLMAVRRDKSVSDETGDPTGRIIRSLRYNQTIRVDGAPVEGWLKLLDSLGYAMIASPHVGQLLELVAEGPHALSLALEDCEAAIALQANTAEAYLLASRCQVLQGEFQEAEAVLRRGEGAVKPRELSKIQVQLRNLQKIVPKLSQAADLLTPDFSQEEAGKRALGHLKEAARLGASAMKVRPLQLHALLQARQYVRAFEAKKLAEEILKNAPGTPSPKDVLLHGAAGLLCCQEEGKKVLQSLVQEAKEAGSVAGQGPAMEWFEVVFKNVLVKKRCDEKAPSWCLLEKGRKVMVLPKRETDAKGQDWVELAPFELHRLCGDCRDHRGDSSAEARGFLLIDGSALGLGALLRPVDFDPGPALRAGALLRAVEATPELKAQGDRLLKRGEAGEARKCYAAAHAGGSWDADLRAQLHLKTAEAFRLEGELEEAWKEVTEALCFMDRARSAPALLLRGILRFDSGKWRESLEDLEKAQDLAARAQQILKELAMWLRRAREAVRRNDSRNFYAILGLRCDCDAADVKKRFHKLALQCHPDKVHSTSEVLKKSAEARFKAIQEAYEEKEEYLAAILNCVDSFFNGPFQACICKDETAGEQLQILGQKYLKRFKMLDRSAAFRARLPASSMELLSIAAYRVMTAVEGKADTATLLESNENHTDTKELEVSSPDQELWHRLIQALREDPRCQERLRRQSHLLGQAFLTIYEETDPEYPPYLKNLTSETEMDFRRHAITVQDCIHRLVQHCEGDLHDLPSLRRTMRVFLAMIGMAQSEDAKKEDTQQLTYIQVELSKAGVGKLLVKVLNNHAVQDVQRLAWHVLGELLQSRGADGEAKVNKVVQVGLHEAMSSSDDDTGMWESFHEILSTAGRAAKFVHGFRTLPVLTSQEKARLREYDDLLEQAVDAIQAVRMLVEGQFKAMQDYLYSQEGNVRSFNVPGLCCWLLTRLCKDAQGANYASLSELKCIKFVVVLLTELAQGPNPRNQEFLSNMGLIELVFKLLMVNFQQLQKSEGDVYPSAVRQLKAELLRMLLSLMEGRLDARIHQTILQRGDPLVIRARIEFIYLYFTLGAVAINPRQVTRQNLAAIPLDGNLHALMLPQADPSELFTAVSRNSALVTEFLEDLDDEQLGVLFAEGFCLIELVYELSAHSSKFKKEVMPMPEEQDPFVDSEAEYRTRRDYLRERAAWQKRQIYRQAFDFLGRYVKTLEVVLNGHLQSLNFRVPVTAVWYVQGASKQRILDEVPFSLPDVKMKSFIQMCVELNNESRLILALSRFSLCPQRYRRWAQLYLPDGVHRPFWVFLANDAKHMQNLMRSSLYLSLCLALHAGLFLVAPKEADGDLMWASPMAQRISEILGALHLACTLLWLCLYTCIQVPLSIKKVQTQYPKRNSLVNICAAWGRYMSQRLLQWRGITLILTSLALFRRHWWVYSFLLADFFAQSPSLQTVLSGVVAPAWPLFMTFLGAGIITFVYGAIGLHNFRDEFGMYCDQNIMVCTQSILYMGTRAGIVGLSGMMDQVGPEDDLWFQRMVYDISYFVIFGVMLLNTIVALIVDSFQTQRREATARENNLETQSFISSIDRKVIESVAQASGIVDGFEYHETYRQNKWDYMAFVFHLREKHALNFTGPESQIRQFIDSSDVTWLPIGRSKMLEGKSAESQEDTLTLIQKQNSRIIGALQQTQDNRKTLFKAIGSLARSMRDKTESVQDQLKIILAQHSESGKDSPLAASGISRPASKKTLEPESRPDSASRRPAAPADHQDPEDSGPPAAFATNLQRPRRLSMY